MNKFLKFIIGGMMCFSILSHPLSTYAMTTTENIVLEEEKNFDLDKSKASLMNIHMDIDIVKVINNILE